MIVWQAAAEDTEGLAALNRLRSNKDLALGGVEGDDALPAEAMSLLANSKRELEVSEGGVGLACLVFFGVRACVFRRRVLWCV